MTGLSDERPVAYRERRVWFWVLSWLVALGIYGLGSHDLTLTWPLTIWLVGIVLVEVNGILAGLRSMRGLTLAADGITWHKREMFVPWSNVADLGLADGRGGRRLVVLVVDLDQALRSVSRFGRYEIRSNVQRFGSPIALKTHQLASPAKEVMADAERRRKEYAAAGGFAGFADPTTRSRRERATRSANVWAVVGGAGLVLTLLSVFLAAPWNEDAQVPALTFQFQSISDPGFMDQVVDIKNSSETAVAPTLVFVPLDGDYRQMIDITVRTAYGSDHGMVVIPPHSHAIEVLAFDGPNFRKVARVETIVLSKKPMKFPVEPMIAPLAKRIDSSGNPAEVLEPFSSLSIYNPVPAELSVRLVCFIWEQPPPGSPQQILAAIPIGGLIEISPRGTTTVPVTGPIKDRTEDCGSVKAYFSR